MAAKQTIEYIWRSAQAFRVGRVSAIQGIILHSTDGHEAGDINTLTGPEVSVHWYVTRTGKVYHFVQDKDTAFHAGKVIALKYSNAATLGIEQEHIDGDQDWPAVQIDTVGQLCAFLIQRHDLDATRIYSHAHGAS